LDDFIQNRHLEDIYIDQFSKIVS